MGAIAALICVLLTSVPSQARVHRSQSWAETQFTRAEAQRQRMEGRAEQARTRREYESVIASYRRIYFEAPNSTKAHASVFAVAELTAEMGRHFKDDSALFAAVREYKFLRREYPGSGYRIEALLAIGEIYKNDLGDSSDARGAFEELLRRYPHSKLAEEARAELTAVQKAQADAKAAEEKDEKTASAANDDDSGKSTAAGDQSAESPVRVTSVDNESQADYTRITVDLERNIQFESQRLADPDRIFFDLKNAQLAQDLMGKNLEVDDPYIKRVRIAQFNPDTARIVLETAGPVSYNSSLNLNPPRLVIDVHGDETRAAKSGAAGSGETIPAKPSGGRTITTTSNGVKKVIVDADDDDDDAAAGQSPPSKPAPLKATKAALRTAKAKPGAAKTKARVTAAVRESQPTADGDRSLIRALGLKIGKIVIDPGHGGHDTGTIGPHGLLEKNLVLDVSRRLGKLLQARLGADVVFTRRDDTFIPLETRTAIANQEQADLFVSVHANSSRDPDARGVETYYLNFTSSSEALEVAARENAASDKSIHELQDLVKKIALKEKIEESREFASDIQDSLHSGLAAKAPGIRDRGVKKAPFVVLIGANMPSILAEISFISNPGDERRLKTAAYRQRIAEALYRGIANYVNGLGGVKVATRLEKASAD